MLIHPLFRKPSLTGILYIASIALVSYLSTYLSLIKQAGISSLVVAIILGIILGNSWRHPAAWLPGIQFCAKRLLRLAIMLYGFRISFQQIAEQGCQITLLDLIVVSSTLIGGYYIGKRLLRLDTELALLISSGAAICGAAAVLAVEDILKCEPHKTSAAIATVVIFGVLSMFLYPALQQSGYLGLSPTQFGVFAGASIHEVAQVIVAGTNISPEAGETAIVVKMIRVLLLVPVLFIISTMKLKKRKILVPWFALGFILVVGLHSLNIFSDSITNGVNQLDTILLTMAMAAIGSETKLAKVLRLGFKPFYLAAILFFWLGSSVYLLTYLWL